MHQGNVQSVIGPPATMMAPLVRFQPYPDEWWPSFLRRFLAANGVAEPSGYELGEVNTYFEQAKGPGLERIHRTRYRQRGWECSYGHHSLPPGTLRNEKQERVAVCPICIANRPYVRLAWMLTPYEICTQHGLKLQNTCARCGAPWTLTKLLQGGCCCGRDAYALADDMEAQPGCVSVNSAIWARVLGDAHHGANDDGAPTVAQALLTSRLLNVVADCDPALRRAAGESSWMERAWRWMVDTGRDIEGILKSSEALLNSLDSWDALVACRAVLEQMEIHERYWPSVCSSLPLAAWEQQTWARAKSRQPRGQHVITQDHWQRSLGFLTLRGFASILKIPPTSVLCMIEEGLLEPAHRLARKSGVVEWLFLRSQVEGARQLVEMREVRQASLARLGFERRTFRPLARSEVLRRSDRYGLAAIDEEEAWALHQRLCDVALRRASLPAGVVSIASPSCWAPNTWQGMKATVQDILDGKLPVFLHGSSEGFRSLYVYANVVIARRRQYLAHHRGFGDAGNQRDLFDGASVPPTVRQSEPAVAT